MKLIWYGLLLPVKWGYKSPRNRIIRGWYRRCVISGLLHRRNRWWRNRNSFLRRVLKSGFGRVMVGKRLGIVRLPLFHVLVLLLL